MEVFTEEKFCKYCGEKLVISLEEGLECSECNSNVHVKCLRRGSAPGCLYGDLFFSFTCQECSPDNTEVFSRIKLSWLQAVALVLYHLQTKCPHLASKGFFHWRQHIGKYIETHWEILFSRETKRKKQWTGMVTGTLSRYSDYIFLSGKAALNKPATWTLMYPKLTPYAISCLYSVMIIEKQEMKNKQQTLIPDADLFRVTVRKYISHKDCLEVITDSQIFSGPKKRAFKKVQKIREIQNAKHKIRRRNIVPHISEKFFDECALSINGNHNEEKSSDEQPTTSSSDFLDNPQNHDKDVKEELLELDPKYHFNTCFINYSKMKGISLYTKLMGGLEPEPILSPYSGIQLKPYIRRDTETFPPWLKLMAEIQIVANEKNRNYVLPPRGPVDYKYVQPEHIPAINSLCNHFFWPGIDMTEALQYPDFSCVALYKRLVVGFAFVVPDITYTENYISFMFTRPHWRNCGIGSFMLYHLIQTSQGKDITLHVSMNNPALCLYEKFGFEIEKVQLNFYDKYVRKDVNDSKDAFFCRLER
nr:cysteine-rich protein 2-binding protein-like [Leptinotarsa decemlineata]